MRIAILVLLFAHFASAQAPSAASPAACGPESISFSVKTEKSQLGPVQPDPQKALVYFIQDNGPMGNHFHGILRIGLDGKWVGAYKHNSYFSVSVEPGEHHVCVNVQQGPLAGLIALAHFTAEEGKVYYFRTQCLSGITTMYPTPPHLNLDRPDSDEAKYLIESYPISQFQPTK